MNLRDWLDRQLERRTRQLKALEARFHESGARHGDHANPESVTLLARLAKLKGQIEAFALVREAYTDSEVVDGS